MNIDEIPEKLKLFIDSLPLPEPTRIVASVDGDETVVEWHINGKYYEVSEEDGKLSIMYCPMISNDSHEDYVHWDILHNKG